MNIWGIASVTSVKWGEVTTPGYTFTINYKNSAQNKNSQVSYTLDSGSGSPQFTFAGEEPSDTYVSCCSSFSIHLRMIQQFFETGQSYIPCDSSQCTV